MLCGASSNVISLLPVATPLFQRKTSNSFGAGGRHKPTALRRSTKIKLKSRQFTWRSQKHCCFSNHKSFLELIEVIFTIWVLGFLEYHVNRQAEGRGTSAGDSDASQTKTWNAVGHNWVERACGIYAAGEGGGWGFGGQAPENHR